MRGLTRPRSLAGVLAALMAIAGCGGQGSIESGDYTIYVHGTSLLPRGGMTAGVLGTLAIRDGCVVLEWEEEGLWYPVVWPAGTSIASAEPFVLRLPSGEDLALGEGVIGAGGYLSPEDLEVEILDHCLGETREVAVFNPDDDPEKAG
ncbi:MAG: hypothetical protein L0Z49_14545 [Actinobacteria bacterium]|nr:hypothetical protein [Actinomycetota bacterium]MCI0545638.1 hypothetical protein [Actinomycetota bacterium]